MRALGRELQAAHWTNAGFTACRRMLGLRTKMMTLAVAELIGIVYYRALATGLGSHFCPSCGSTVYWFPEFRPGAVAVAAGAFADASFPSPERLVWTEHRHPTILARQSLGRGAAGVRAGGALRRSSLAGDALRRFRSCENSQSRQSGFANTP